MEIKLIKTKSQYNQAINRVVELLASKINSKEGNELDVLMLLVERYETYNIEMPPSDPVEAIKFLMEQKDLN